MTTDLDRLIAMHTRMLVEGDLDAASEFFLPQAEAEGVMAYGRIGPQDFKEFVAAFLHLIRNPSFRFNQTLEQDDWIWSHITIQAVSNINKRPVQVSGQLVTRFQDGMIAEAYARFGLLEFFAAGGQLPEGALPRLLSGQKIT